MLMERLQNILNRFKATNVQPFVRSHVSCNLIYYATIIKFIATHESFYYNNSYNSV